MVLALLETGYGLKDHKASLMRLYPSLVSISKQHTFGAWDSLFSGDKIEDTFIYDVSKGPNSTDDAKRSVFIFHAANVAPYCTNPGQCYVALSRVRDIGRMHTMNSSRLCR